MDKASLAEKWEASRNRFGIWTRYSSTYPDSIQLGEYKVVISQNGKLDTEYFMTAFNNNNPNESTGWVYSHAVDTTPKFVTAPATLVAEKKVGQNVITVAATGVSEDYYGVFFWLYNASNQLLGIYEIAWPLTDLQTPDFSIDQLVTESEINDTASIVVGFLAEDPLPDSIRFMMYRYLHRITF